MGRNALMIKQVFHIENYWKVIVFYDVDYNLFDIIDYELKLANFSDDFIYNLWNTIIEGEAKAATCSNLERHISIVIFNYHVSKKDYLNSIVHEAEHIKQAMLDAYDVEDVGEPPAYTIGHIISRMYPIIKDIICYKCS